MAGLSRVPHHGTVFSRIKNLLRAGVIKERDRPLWYDVMVAFPPVDDNSLVHIEHGPLIREILYPEDKIRAKFYKVYGTQRALNLTRHNAVSTTPCQRFIVKYQELEKNWDGNDDALFEATVKELTDEGFHLRKRGQKGITKQITTKKAMSDTLASLFQKALSTQEHPETTDRPETKS